MSPERPGRKDVAMDQKLLAWARAVKARRARVAGKSAPVLWLFTDADRLPDPLPSIARLPAGAGVVFRPEGVGDRHALGRAIARLCRTRGLELVVAGDLRMAHALHAGVHLRAGRRPGSVRLPSRRITCSVHDVAELRRATRAGATVAFLSPAFPTESHRGARALGALRWSSLARHGGASLSFYALGGVNGSNVRRLARAVCAGAAAINSLTIPICGQPATVFRDSHEYSAHPIAISLSR